MDLFSEVAEPPADPQPDWLPTDAELTAQDCGQERAGVPGWSESARRLGERWRAFLDAQDESQREFLERVEAESYRAARRRKLATAAMESSLLPGADA